MGSSLTVIRPAVFAMLVVFSLIILALNANFLNLSISHHLHGDDGDDDDDDDDDDNHPHKFSFETTAVAVAALSLLTVIPVLIMNFVRRRSVVSIVLLEIGWVSVLLVLWVVTAAQTSGTAIFESGCSDTDVLITVCHQFQLIQVFSWLNFIILLMWLATVIVVAAMAQNRGHPGVWTYPFSDAIFLSRPRSPLTPVETKTVTPAPSPHIQSPDQGLLRSIQSPAAAQAPFLFEKGDHQNTPSPHGQHQSTFEQHQERTCMLPQV